MNGSEIAKLIDHTILKPTATKDVVIEYCKEALQAGFASVCVNPYHVKTVAECLRGSDVKVCTVIGFPLGANSTRVKEFEAKIAVEDGAQELDMVINIGALKEKQYDIVENDIRKVVEASGKNTVKVIIENCFLNQEEKIVACELAKKAGAEFVKTSTGFGSGGATVDDIKLMKRTVKEDMKIKAAGGIRSLEFVRELIESGADRIGTSSGIPIIDEAKNK